MKTFIALFLMFIGTNIVLLSSTFGPQVSETEAIHTECVQLARLYCPADEQAEAVSACVRGVDLGIESFGECEVER